MTGRCQDRMILKQAKEARILNYCAGSLRIHLTDQILNADGRIGGWGCDPEAEGALPGFWVT